MKILLSGIIFLLFIIVVQLSHIRVSLMDWRPVRTYHFYDERSYDVSSVDNLNICDRLSEKRR